MRKFLLLILVIILASAFVAKSDVLPYLRATESERLDLNLQLMDHVICDQADAEGNVVCHIFRNDNMPTVMECKRFRSCLPPSAEMHLQYLHKIDSGYGCHGYMKCKPIRTRDAGSPP